MKETEDDERSEAGNREEAGLSQGTEKEELGVTGSPIGSGILRKTESVRWTVLLRKAMNLNETEDAPSSERRILGGIGESRNADTESGCSPIPSFPRRRESRKGDESGRSMGETLGVLAIMGLLAIGGVMGYRYAVDKYLSNELWNNVKWISVQVMTDGSLRGMGTGEELTVKSFSGDSDSGWKKWFRTKGRGVRTEKTTTLKSTLTVN